MSHTTTRMDPERLRAIQDRRRSGAHGKHDSRPRRARTRATAKRAAVSEYR